MGTLPQISGPLPGPNARRIIERDGRILSPSYTRSYPLVVESGCGAMVRDVDGNIFLDFAAGIAVCATGHCHPEVVRAIQGQAEKLIHISGTDFYVPNMVDLAKKLDLLEVEDMGEGVHELDGVHDLERPLLRPVFPGADDGAQEIFGGLRLLERRGMALPAH